MHICLADTILQYNYNDHKYVIVYMDKTSQICRYHTCRLSNRVKIITNLVEIYRRCRKQFQVTIVIDYSTIPNIHTYNKGLYEIRY